MEICYTEETKIFPDGRIFYKVVDIHNKCCGWFGKRVGLKARKITSDENVFLYNVNICCENGEINLKSSCLSDTDIEAKNFDSVNLEMFDSKMIAKNHSLEIKDSDIEFCVVSNCGTTSNAGSLTITNSKIKANKDNSIKIGLTEASNLNIENTLINNIKAKESTIVIRVIGTKEKTSTLDIKTTDIEIKNNEAFRLIAADYCDLVIEDSKIYRGGTLKCSNRNGKISAIKLLKTLSFAGGEIRDSEIAGTFESKSRILVAKLFIERNAKYEEKTNSTDNTINIYDLDITDNASICCVRNNTLGENWATVSIGNSAICDNAIVQFDTDLLIEGSNIAGDANILDCNLIGTTVSGNAKLYKTRAINSNISNVSLGYDEYGASVDISTIAFQNMNIDEDCCCRLLTDEKAEQKILFLNPDTFFTFGIDECGFDYSEKYEYIKNETKNNIKALQNNGKCSKRYIIEEYIEKTLVELNPQGKKQEKELEAALWYFWFFASYLELKKDLFDPVLFADKIEKANTFSKLSDQSRIDISRQEISGQIDKYIVPEFITNAISKGITEKARKNKSVLII